MHLQTSFSFEKLEWDKILTSLKSRTQSDLGKLQFDTMRPLADVALIEKELKLNAEAQHIVTVGLAFPLNGCSDITIYLEKLSIQGSMLTTEGINKITRNLEVVDRMLKAVNTYKEDCPCVHTLSKQLSAHPKTVKYVREKVDEDENVLDSASPALKKIRRQIHGLQERMRQKIESLVRQYGDSGKLQERHFSIKNGRFVLPVKDGSHKAVQGVTHQISSTGGTHFIEPIEILEMNNQISQLLSNEREEIEKILMEITGTLSEIHEDIEHNQSILAKLDYHYACGSLGRSLQSAKPDIVTENKVVLINARHPLLILKKEQIDEVVPLNVSLGESFSTLVISGPNAGGKTVALKCLGLLSLMVQFGLPVPVSDGSCFPVFKRIIADIGDPQSIEDDLSTFSAKLMNVRTILQERGKGDLILMDEIGSGTDPHEGVSLATAIIEHLTDNGVLTVVTTHHSALKVFASEHKNIENASLIFDEKNLKPTYLLTVGVPGSSYAIELSERIGIPESVIRRTKTLLGEEQLQMENLIRNLESQTAKYAQNNKLLKQRTEELEKLINEYKGKKQTVEKDLYAKIEDELDHNETRLKEFNKELEALIKDIRETNASHESIVKAKGAIQKEVEKVKKKKVKQKKFEKYSTSTEPIEEVKIGNLVRLKDQNQVGTVVAENPSKNRVTVQLDTLRIEVEKSRLERVKENKKPKTVDRLPDIRVEQEIHLRGLEVPEAMETIDKYLSDAIATGYTTIRVVHGKGMGVLRKNITEFLKTDARVEDFRLGSWGEGDTGVTIVNLK